ncbi:MAG: acyltransferase [Lachnospiraceae bacterium]
MCEHKINQPKEKTVYLEVCRIIALFCIMYQHTGGRGADAYLYTDSRWVYMMSLIGTIISRIGVPLFWMISGELLLSKEEPWQKVYKKRIPRIAGALILFSVVRYLYLCIMDGQAGTVSEFAWKLYSREIFLPYWFLYAYLGILLVLPFIKRMIRNLTEQEEMVLFILILGWNILHDISKIFLNTDFVINLSVDNSICYFVLGYMMSNDKILRKDEKRGLWLSIAAAVLVIGCVYLWTGYPVFGEIHGDAAEGCMVMPLTVSVYYMLRYISNRGKCPITAIRHIILWCGGNVFGIYLIEDYLRNGTAVIWEKLAPHISAVPACLIWLLVVFLIGNILVAGLRRLPLLRNIL